MKQRFAIAPFAAAAALIVWSGPPTRAQVPEKLPTADSYAIGTFENLGLYHRSKDVGECKVRFRPTGASDWKNGLPLWFDARGSQYRGGLVLLQPNTNYEIELLPGGKTVRFFGQTRGDKFPVGETTLAPEGDTFDPITITQSGTPNAYHLVTVPPGKKTSLDIGNAAPTAITIDADYVVVRGLELRNAERRGILIKKKPP